MLMSDSIFERLYRGTRVVGYFFARLLPILRKLISARKFMNVKISWSFCWNWNTSRHFNDWKRSIQLSCKNSVYGCHKHTVA